MCRMLRGVIKMRTKASGSDQAHMLLRRRILRLDLKPGTELDEVTLSHSLGVSRTPIREALIRLSSEGLVTLQRGRGARVTPLDLTTFRSFFEGLDILQRAVTRLAALRRTPADLKTIKLHLLAFEKGAKSFDSEALNDANYEFHTAIGNAARSWYLANAYSRILAEVQRVSYLCFSDLNREDCSLQKHLAQTMQDHRMMFEAIEKQDAEVAEKIAREHVWLFRDRVTSVLMSSELVQGISVVPTK